AFVRRKYSCLVGRSRNVQRLRTLLDRNPFQWQVEHNRRSIAAAWLACVIIMALWLVGWTVWGIQWLTPPCLYATSFLLAMVVDLFQMHSAARDVALHRRD